MNEDELLKQFEFYFWSNLDEFTWAENLLTKLCHKLDETNKEKDIFQLNYFYNTDNFDNKFFIKVYIRNYGRKKNTISIQFDLTVKDFFFLMYKDSIKTENLSDLINFTATRVKIFIDEYIQENLL